MMKATRFRYLLAASAMALFTFATGSAEACSVCFGDPESSMAAGARAGVIVLGGIVYSQIMLMGGVGAYWFMRSRKIARERDADRDLQI